MNFVLRSLTVIIVVCVLVVGQGRPRLFASSPVVTAGDTDRAALVALYQATNGANWVNSDNWLSDAPLDAWHGVTTDDSGRVIELVLPRNGLSGTIPLELGNANLIYLDVSANELSGEIPSELGNLTNLTWLSLAENQLSGAIPSELGNLTNLTDLYLWDDQLSGTIPSELGNLTNLTWLSLWGNQLSGTIPSELGNLTNLTNLSLSENQLSGTIPAELDKLANLTGLGLSENQLSGTIPSELGNLTNLKVLTLSHNELSGTIPSELGNLTNLTWLELLHNELSGTIPSELGKPTNLIGLYLWGNQLSGTIPAELGNLANLTRLGLSENQLSGAIPSELGKLTNLTDLYLWGNQLSGTIPSELGNLTNLKVLKLSHNELSGTIPSELGKPTNLTDLYLWGNQLSGTIPAELGKLANLTGLGLSENQLSGAIPSELGKLTNLEVLRLWGNQLSGTIPSELGNLTNLKMLKLSHNELSGTIPSELGKLTNLTWLDLSHNELSGTIPSELGKLTNLIELDLWGNQLSGMIPVVSIHNPLVIPIGDTPAVSGGPFQDWPAVEDEAHGLKIFYPKWWLFASSKEELSSLLPQMGDPAIAGTVLDEQATYIDSLTAAGEEDQFAGLGFLFEPNSPPAYINRFALLAIPAAGRTLEEYAQLLAARLDESEAETLEHVGVGPGLRPWGEKAASIRYRSGGTVVDEGKVVTRPGTEVVGWQVVLLSPDSGTFLLITFDVWGEEFDRRLEPFLRDIVRRVQWLDHPAYDPPVGPTVTITRTMYVRGGPGTDHPIISTAIEAEQYAAISTNAAGDWWQIGYDGQLAWVYGGFVKPSADAENALQADAAGWLTYDDSARGLSLSYPSGWHFFDPAQPSQIDLSLFSAAVKGREGERLDVAEMGALVSAMSVRRDDAVIGLGLQSGAADAVSSNFMVVYSLAAEGTTLERYAKMAAEHSYSIEPASVELVRGLRPLSEEAVSIRYRESETASEVWQVVLLSPDGERLLVLAFSVHSDEFAALQPMLREIVQRLRWAEPPSSGVG